MRFFFDARFIRTDFHDGISRFSCSIANAIYKLDPNITFIIHNDKQLDFLPKGAKHITLNSPESPKELCSGRKLAKFHPDVVFSPMQMLRPNKSYKLILTIHDLIYYRHHTPPTHFKPWVRLGWRLYHLSYLPERIMLRGADHVVAVSYATKHEIEKAKLTKKTISVIYNAPSDHKKYVKKVKNDRIDNLVYMGSFVPYKNVETLITGLQYLPGRTLHLLSRIGTGRKRQLEALVPKGAKIVFYNGVSDEKYAKLLANNAALVSASYDEGFGIAVAEAMNLGVPVVLSDIPAHREVAGSAGVFFTTNEPAAFAKAVKILDDDVKRQNHIKLGKQQVKRFTWEKSAQTLLNVVKGLYEEKA